MKPLAEFYGWTHTESNGMKAFSKKQCIECGNPIEEQVESMLFECERCMNERED